jgi:aminodeoxyfutalosine synthase
MLTLKEIENKILQAKRITTEEALYLYQKAPLSLLGSLAHQINVQKNKEIVFYNKNLHIEPTNLCVFHCKFCSYYAKTKDDSWEYSSEDILKQIENKINDITEVHVVGGVHPQWGLSRYVEIINGIRNKYPKLHIKAFSAVEIAFLAKRAKLSFFDTLTSLKEAGLDSIPGGGAEIFHSEVRKKICPEKVNTEEWLEIHKLAHSIGIASNATILYGHIENAEHIIDHLNKLRELQDKSKGFNCFIPLKFKSTNNEMSYIEEVSVVEDLKMMAISRIFLDNFKNIKAYWPMLGRETAAISLHFGVNDLDGTVNDSTKIYSRAGQKEKQEMTVEEITKMISGEGKEACERDSLYNAIGQSTI